MPKAPSYLYHFNGSCGSGNNLDLYGHVARNDSNISANQAAEIPDQYQLVLCWDFWVQLGGRKHNLEPNLKGRGSVLAVVADY